ncbi:MAG TPA: thaumatin family protein, partial [Terriglobales bacterium]|nr:thaumatin family protein [Terriglobales bacterium]
NKRIPASNTCCGCAAWPWPTNDVACQNDNPAFEMFYFPKIEFLKMACPTAYTYQYDDETSTFHCLSKFDQSKGQGNALSYTITFCPGGLEGGVGD